METLLFLTGGHQDLWKGHESQNAFTYTHAPCWSWLVMCSNCFALQELFSAVHVTFAHIFFQDSTHCDTLTKALIVILNASGSNRIHLSDALVTNSVGMACI